MASHSASVAEDGHVEPEEPPERRVTTTTGPARFTSIYKKSAPHSSKRTSLLTQQLHTNSSDQHSESDATSPTSHPLVRGLSASSGRSVPSTYELISDNDMSSAGIRTASPSPPPHVGHPAQGLGITKKAPLAAEPLILGHDTLSTPDSEKLIEADLGRRRCITFACGGGSGQRSPVKPEIPTIPVAPPKDESVKEEAPVKRKCALTFACPSRESAEDSDLFATLSRKSTLERVPQLSKATGQSTVAVPPEQYDHVDEAAVLSETMPRVHRDSDATVRQGSPVAFKKPMFVKRRTYSVDLHKEQPESPGAFHEFGGSMADDAWTTEIDLNRPAMTMRDCLYKENLIRQLGDEADQEALEDEEVYGEEATATVDLPDDEEDSIEAEDDDDDDDDDDEDEDEEDDEDTDEDLGSLAVSETGFDSDDEGGLEDDDDEDDDSDYEWWTPGSNSKPKSASTSGVLPTRLRALSASSLDTDDDEVAAAGSFLRGRTQSASKTISAVAEALPDSTDFVCGTLDEDHPLEQVYMSQLAKRRAQKQHKDAIQALREGEQSQPDGTTSPRLGYITSQHGSVSSRAARSGTSRHVSREPSPYPTRNLKVASRAVSREPSPYPNRTLKPSGPMAGRTKHNRSPAPNRLRFRDASSQRPRSPAPVRGQSSQSPEEEGRRLSDPGTPAQPMFIHGTQTPTRRPKSRKTFSLPRESMAIPINRPRCLRFADDDSAPLFKTFSMKQSLA